MSSAGENLRRFVIGSPPWVLFMLSLSIMALGILVLAFHVGSDQHTDRGVSSVNFCADSASTKTMPYPYKSQILVPIVLKTARGFSQEVEKSGRIWLSGTLHSGQLGLLGTGPMEEDWKFVTVLASNDSKCQDKQCDILEWRICMLLMSNRTQSLSQLITSRDDAVCPANVTQHIRNKLADSASTMNALESKFEFLREGKEDDFCNHGYNVNMRISEDHQFVLIPLMHDTVAARMHLLCTSYFLFLTLFVIVGYAMCKGHKASRTFEIDSMEIGGTKE